MSILIKIDKIYLCYIHVKGTDEMIKVVYKQSEFV